MNCYLALANKLCGQHAWPNLRVAGAIRAEEQAERPESRSTALLPSAASPPHCVLVERMWTAPGPKNTQQHNSLQAVSIAFQQDADRVRGVARLLTLPPRLTSPPRKTTTEEQACSSSLVLQGLAFFPVQETLWGMASSTFCLAGCGCAFSSFPPKQQARAPTFYNETSLTSMIGPVILGLRNSEGSRPKAQASKES